MITKYTTYQGDLDRQIDLICKVIPPQHGVVSPKSLATPRYLGDRYVDTVTNATYTATKTDNTGWVESFNGAIVGSRVYADNATALAGGLVAGQLYRTATGQVMIVY